MIWGKCFNIIYEEHDPFSIINNTAKFSAIQKLQSLASFIVVGWSICTK